jgi:hypothetical protein
MLLRHGLSRVDIIGHVQVSRVRVGEWRAERGNYCGEVEG